MDLDASTSLLGVKLELRLEKLPGVRLEGLGVVAFPVSCEVLLGGLPFHEGELEAWKVRPPRLNFFPLSALMASSRRSCMSK